MGRKRKNPTRSVERETERERERGETRLKRTARAWVRKERRKKKRKKKGKSEGEKERSRGSRYNASDSPRLQLMLRSFVVLYQLRVNDIHLVWFHLPHACFHFLFFSFFPLFLVGIDQGSLILSILLVQLRLDCRIFMNLQKNILFKLVQKT